MLSNNQIILPLTTLVGRSFKAMRNRVALCRVPHDDRDDFGELLETFTVLARSVDTGYRVNVSFGEASLDFFDGDASKEVARLNHEKGLATAMLAFVEQVIDHAIAVEPSVTQP